MSRSFAGLGAADVLPPAVVDAFDALAGAQRREPEDAMQEVQSVLGGGGLEWLVENVGDLTHRMAERTMIEGAGYGNVRSKVDGALRILRAGFEAALARNVENNAFYRGKTVDDFWPPVRRRLRAYAAAHAKLVVYNRAQWLAREAAVALGREEWTLAYLYLRDLENRLGSWPEWTAFATEFKMDAAGVPVPWEMR